MSFTATALPILSDNYAWLLVNGTTGYTAIVDPAEEAPIVEALEARGGRLDAILITHHHDDHIAAVQPLRARYGATVFGAAADAGRLPPLTVAVRAGERFELDGAPVQVIDTPGHTLGHIAYYIEPGSILLCGDTLFSLGCGRLLEGSAADMFGSLQRLAALPADALVCCGHEYTQSNARFALTEEPDNAALRARAAAADALRAEGRPTVPTLLEDELAQNPFLHAADVQQFGAMRARKDSFR